MHFYISIKTSFVFCLLVIFTLYLLGFFQGFFFITRVIHILYCSRQTNLKKNHESFPQSSRAGCFRIKVHLLYHSYVMGSQSVYLFCISLHIAALNQTAFDHGKENTEALIQQQRKYWILSITEPHQCCFSTNCVKTTLELVLT